ncbi:MAG TPA: TetR/AcrR family transcriptional regulator, partial [Microbacterium sp.]|uniref:TetR/AcrR family transcriptional regulator n=1 Tax=Microbacterium sp. TaxID=51671 RepID=UPI002C197FB3
AVPMRGSRSRDALRRAATDLLDQRDAWSISITDVVREAKVTRPTFYQAFDGLSDLFTAAALGRLEAAFDRIDLELAPAQENVQEVMGGAFTIVVRALAEHEAFYLRVVNGPGGNAVVTAVTDAVSGRLKAASPVVALLEDGVMPADSARSALAAGAVWLIIDWLASPSPARPPIETIASRARDFVYGCVVGGLASVSPPSTLVPGVDHSLPTETEPLR